MKTIHIATVAAFSAMVTEDLLALGSKKEGAIHIALPGGRSASAIVKGILQAKEIAPRVTLTLVDERLEGERNADTLYDAGLQEAVESGLMSAEQLIIPKPDEPLGLDAFDRVYLGIGEDGHFASLFPNTYTTEVEDAVITIDNSPKPPPKRITFSYTGFRTIAKESPIYLLFFGEGKREALKRLLDGNDSAHELPAAFFCDEGFDTTVVTDLEGV